MGNQRVILLDGEIFLHQACTLASERFDWGEGEVVWRTNVDKAAAHIRGRLAELRRRLGVKDVVVALGCQDRDYWRKDLWPDYKSSRRHSLKPPGYRAVEEAMEANLPTVRLPRLEGDDVLGILATSPARAHLRQVIVTIDKDLDQIPGRVYNPDTDVLKEVTPEEGDRFHLVQALTGDRTDGYPGCPGVGPKRAPRILDDEDAESPWAAVVEAYEKAGQSEEEALVQARVARILRYEEYDRDAGEPILWTP